MVPAEHWGAERLTGTESLVPGVPRVPRGIPTHRVSGTKDSTCGTSRVLGCRETHWHRELGTRGYRGYRGVPTHRVSGTKDSTVVPVECWGAERLTGTESVVPGVPRVPRGTNT